MKQAFMEYHETIKKYNAAIEEKLQPLEKAGVNVCKGGSGIAEWAQIYKGIPALANELGVELEVKSRGDNRYPFEASFVYDGIRYLQLFTEPDNIDK